MKPINFRTAKGGVPPREFQALKKPTTAPGCVKQLKTNRPVLGGLSILAGPRLPVASLIQITSNPYRPGPVQRVALKSFW